MRRVWGSVLLLICMAGIDAVAQQAQTETYITTTGTSASTTPGAPRSPTTSTTSSSESQQEATIDLARDERYELERFRLERDLQKDILEWAQTRFWVVVFVTVLIGFFGVRALVREMIASELREATRATAQAQAAAEQTPRLTKEVRSDAEKYRLLVDELSSGAATVDQRFHEVSGRINPESDHSVAAADLKVAELTQQVNELSDVVKRLADESKSARELIHDYERRAADLGVAAASKRERFADNSKYDVLVAHYGEDTPTGQFAAELRRELTGRGFKAVDGKWVGGDTTSFGNVNIDYPHGDRAAGEGLQDVVKIIMERRGTVKPIRLTERPAKKQPLENDPSVLLL